MRANGINEPSIGGPTGLSGDDPILDRVQWNLADHGSDVMQFIAASAQTAEAGANLMGQIIGLMAQGQPQGGPTVADSDQKSSAGPAIAAGLAGLAVGAAATAAALKGGGAVGVSQFAPGMRGSQRPEAKFHPGPEKKKEAVEVNVVGDTTLSPVAYVGASEPDEFIAKPLTPPVKKPPVKTKPIAPKPSPIPATVPSIPAESPSAECNPEWQDCLNDDGE